MPFIKSSVLLLLFILQIIFLPQPILAASGFVSRTDTKLQLGGKDFRFIGVNRYNLITTGGSPFVGCGSVLSESEIATIFSELKQIGVTAVRFWLFQSFTKSGTDLTRFDYVLTQAAANNIKVIPVFENQWQDCTQGGYKYNDWYVSGYKSPYGSYPLSLKDYIQLIVNKYKDNPAILMWQIMNEAESKVNTTTYTPDNQALYDFTNDVSSFIKSLDTNHLVSLGTIGGGQPGAAGSAYQTLHSIPTIDVLDYHDYGNETTAIPPLLQTRINNASALKKPLMVTEAGIVTHPDCSNGSTIVIGFKCYSFEERTNLFRSKIDAFFNSPQDAGYMIWSYRDKQSVSDLFSFNVSDSLSTYIASKSAALNQTTEQNKIGDLDGNGKIDIFDYNFLLSNFGKAGSTIPGDVDESGKVDIFDYNIILTNFGK